MIMANNLKRQYDLHADEYEKKAVEVLRSGWYVLGKEVEAFENEWAQYIGAKYCVGIASGLDALWMSFRMLGIGHGDEVIVCANAYIACVMGISINGATPIFVEPDQYDNIDADKIEAAITSNTKAILAVHLYGQACDMTRIMEIAEKYGLRVVEDCAQSHGNHWRGKTVGTFGDIGCFSFYPTKGCGAFGDAGCIVTNDEKIANDFRVFRNYGSEKKYHNKVVGTNSRLDELQAGLLRIKLRHLDEFNAERGTKIVSIGKIHYEPFGIYKGSKDSLDLSNGDKIAVPNDVTNEARSLNLLEAAGLIKLKSGVGLKATKLDIVENPLNLDIVELESAQIPRALDSVAIACMNGNYAMQAKFKVSDALFVEKQDSDAAQTYANILCVKAGNENEKWATDLLNCLKSQKVKDFIAKTYDKSVIAID